MSGSRSRHFARVNVRAYPMTARWGNRPICTDARLLAGVGTGAATYARALRAAQLDLDPSARLLAGPPGTGPRATAARTARAMLPGPVQLGAGFAFPDLFRLAHVHFTIHRRLLPVIAPGSAGVVHWSYPVPLRLVGWRNLYTVHDAIPLLRPALTSIDPRRHRRVLAHIVAEADRIVTVTEAAHAEIVAALGCAPDRVVNCSQPVDVAPVGEVMLPPDLTAGEYLLCCGLVEPRKNIARLLAAYRASGTSLPLVIAGPDGWRADRIAPLIAATPGVRRLPFLDRPTLLTLLAGARALLFPSLAEGFGLPIAEAMALGVPVLAGATPAQIETGGGAVLCVDPEDQQAIARGIVALAGDAGLRAELAARGLVQAKRFTAASFAERLGALYDEVFAEPPRCQ